MMSYFSENEAKNLQNGIKMARSILLKVLTLKWDISRTIWRIEVSDDSFFGIFHALSFEVNLFRPEFPLTDCTLLKSAYLIYIVGNLDTMSCLLYPAIYSRKTQN